MCRVRPVSAKNANGDGYFQVPFRFLEEEQQFSRY
jgi:hypothetical protein